MLVGEDTAVVCVMSGDFVQRGEAAVYSKFARAEAACLSGADLVVELPLPWALSSAEGFARGAVGLLGALGADNLSFGSELGSVDALERLADILLTEEIYEDIKEIQRKDGSISFARARQLAAEKLAGEEAGLLETPNNILGVEYIKAILSQNLTIKPLTVKRIGGAHDSVSTEKVRSASQLRQMLRNSGDIGRYVPKAAYEIYKREKQQGRELSKNENMELVLLSRLRMLEAEEFDLVPDAGDGLADRLYRAVREASSLDEIFSLAKTKRFAMSRVRRAVICAALGITKGMNTGIPPYARILAANEKGCAALRQINGASTVPVISKAAHIKELTPECTEMFAIGAKANELFSLCFDNKAERKPGQDWRSSPFIVKNL